MFDLGMQELIVIFVVALIVFGPQKLPELARSMGKGIAELKKTLHGVKDQIDSEIEEVQKPIEEEISMHTDSTDLSQSDVDKKTGKEQEADTDKTEMDKLEEKDDPGDDKGEVV
jgi:sec-independent protein translocase protein TatB